jgi:hypothetical protein
MDKIMKWILLTFLLLSSLSAKATECAVVDDANFKAATDFMLSSEPVEFYTKVSSAKEYSAERRGCCSHHKGVCGCSVDRAVCCDGALSPSCGCD